MASNNVTTNPSHNPDSEYDHMKKALGENLRLIPTHIYEKLLGEGLEEAADNDSKFLALLISISTKYIVEMQEENKAQSGRIEKLEADRKAQGEMIEKMYGENKGQKEKIEVLEAEKEALMMKISWMKKKINRVKRSLDDI